LPQRFSKSIREQALQRFTIFLFSA